MGVCFRTATAVRLPHDTEKRRSIFGTNGTAKNGIAEYCSRCLFVISVVVFVSRRLLTGYAQTNCSTLVLCSSTEIDHCPFALPHVMTITSATQKTKLAGVVFDERQDIVAVDTAPTIDLWPRTKDAAARADASWVCSWIAFRLSVTYSVSWTGFGTELCSTLFY